LKIYGDGLSGNCYKLHLLLSLLQKNYQWIDVDILKGETQTGAFLKKSANGKVPLLELENGECLTESNAILNFLAQGSALWPDEPWHQAKVLQWQFFEQYSHEPYIAVARFIKRYLGLPDERRTEYDAKQPGGHKALSIMEQQLQQTSFLTGEQFTVADISLYAYTHVAEEGGFELSSYSAINRWLKRIEAMPQYQPMNNSHCKESR
jgi:glutathione S-transferase